MAYYQEQEAPFNMAVATLMRLDAKLQQISYLDYKHPFDSAEKQKAYLNLVKQFYINSIPLLLEEDIKKFSKILQLDINSKSKIKSGTQKVIPYYDKKLDNLLNMYLVDLQIRMKRYFMPKGRDLRRAVANLN